MFPSVLGGNLGKSARVFIKFCRALRAVRPIPLGVFRGKRKKREEKKDIMRELCKFMENHLNLFALVPAVQITISIGVYITMSSIGSRATTLCSTILPIVYTLTSTNLSTHLTGHCTFGQCKISLLPGQFVLKQ